MSNTGDLTILDPGDVRLYHHAGVLRLTLPDHSYRAARVYRAFPLSDPDHYYGLTDGTGKDIAMVVDPSRLDSVSRDAASVELELRYFVPVVRRVIDIRDDYGATVFEVETDRGRKRYVVRGLKDNLVELSHRRLIVTDVDGNRFEIEDVTALDPHSQNVLMKSM